MLCYNNLNVVIIVTGILLNGNNNQFSLWFELVSTPRVHEFSGPSGFSHIDPWGKTEMGNRHTLDGKNNGKNNGTIYGIKKWQINNIDDDLGVSINWDIQNGWLIMGNPDLDLGFNMGPGPNEEIGENQFSVAGIGSRVWLEQHVSRVSGMT